MRSQTDIRNWKPTTSPPSFPLDLTKKTDPVSPFRLRQLSAPFGSPTHVRLPGPFDVLRDMRKGTKLGSETAVGVSLFLSFESQKLGTGGLEAEEAYDGR